MSEANAGGWPDRTRAGAPMRLRSLKQGASTRTAAPPITDLMILLWLVAFALGALGLLLACFGFGSIVHGAAFDAIAYLAVSGLFVYPTYLFGRAALRIRQDRHSNPETPADEQLRRRRGEVLVTMAALAIIGIVVAPIPNPLKVVMTVITVLAVALNLAVADEPGKKRR